MNTVCVIEVINNETLEREVIGYVNNLSDQDARDIREIFEQSLKEDEDFSIRFDFYNGDWNANEIVWEALNVVRE